MVEEELALLPKGADASPLSIYRMVYAMTRQQGLGRRPRGVPPTRRFAHEQALIEARRNDPGFDVSIPSGWLDGEAP
ncbi:MAG TPA: hypothetical protein VGS21_12095 [Acidimicrobiales bacterium]|nr:hypothetical protein [Acidimicrobiales bacterium]